MEKKIVFSEADIVIDEALIARALEVVSEALVSNINDVREVKKIIQGYSENHNNHTNNYDYFISGCVNGFKFNAKLNKIESTEISTSVCGEETSTIYSDTIIYYEGFLEIYSSSRLIYAHDIKSNRFLK